MANETRPSQPEAGKKFEADKFGAYDFISFYDPASKKWMVNQLMSKPIVDRMDGKITLEVKTPGGGTTSIDVKNPPPKGYKYVPSEIRIEGVNYKMPTNFDDFVTDQEGNVFVNLSAPAGSDKSDMAHVGLDTLVNVIEVEGMEKKMDDYKNIDRIAIRIRAIGSTKRKELVAALTELDKRAISLRKELGGWNEWNDQDAKQASSIAEKIKSINEEIINIAIKLRSDLEAVERSIATTKPKKEVSQELVDTADVLLKDVNNKIAEAQMEWDKYQKVKDKYDADIAKFAKEADDLERDWMRYETESSDYNEKDRFYKAWEVSSPVGNPPKKAKAPPLPGRKPIPPTKAKDYYLKMKPGDKDPVSGRVLKPVEPTEPDDTRYPKTKELVAEKMFTLLDPNATVELKKISSEVEKRIIDEVARTGRKLTLDEKHKKDGEVYLAVLEELKKKKVDAVVFDFDKEKNELLAKINGLEGKATSANRDGLLNLKREVGILSKKDKDVESEHDIAELWSVVGDWEIENEKALARVPDVKKPTERVVDIDTSVIVDILQGRAGFMEDLMKTIYDEEMNEKGESTGVSEAIVEKMRALFKDSPDPYTLKQLVKFGIRDWKHFKDLWDTKLASATAGVVAEVARADLRNEIAKDITWWDSVKNQKWQVAQRILINMALVGGATMGAAAIVVASGGTAGLGTALIGGAAGGGVRGLLQKFWFSREKAQKIKQEKMDELVESKRKTMIAKLLERRFGGTPGFTTYRADFDEQMAAIVSTVLRDATEQKKEFENKEDAKFAGRLKGDAKLLYIESLQKMRLEGTEPSDVQKKACAIALEKMMQTGEKATKEAVKDSDPFVIKFLEGAMQRYSGTKGDVYTSAALGAGVGAAFFSASRGARAVMGGIGGAIGGYRLLESVMNKEEKRAAERQAKYLIASINVGYRSWKSGYIIQSDLENLQRSLKLLNHYLKGKADSPAGQNTANVIINDPILSIQAKDLVYQAYRHGFFAQMALGELEKNANQAVKEANDNSNEVVIGTIKGIDIKMKEKNRLKLARFAAKTASIVGGAAVGALAAVFIGEVMRPVVRGAGSVVKDVGVWAGHKVHDIYDYATDTVHPAQAAAPEATAVASVTATQTEMTSGAHGSTSATPDTASAPPEGSAIEIPKNPNYVQEIISDPVKIARGGSIWRSCELFAKEHKADIFKGWSHHDIEQWANSEQQRLHAHQVRIMPGAERQLYLGGDGKPHIRILGVDTGKVKILDHTWAEKGEGVAHQKVAVLKPDLKTDAGLNDREVSSRGVWKGGKSAGLPVGETTYNGSKYHTVEANVEHYKGLDTAKGTGGKMTFLYDQSGNLAGYKIGDATTLQPPPVENAYNAGKNPVQDFQWPVGTPRHLDVASIVDQTPRAASGHLANHDEVKNALEGIGPKGGGEIPPSTLGFNVDYLSKNADNLKVQLNETYIANGKVAAQLTNVFDDINRDSGSRVMDSGEIAKAADYLRLISDEADKNVHFVTGDQSYDVDKPIDAVKIIPPSADGVARPPELFVSGDGTVFKTEDGALMMQKPGGRFVGAEVVYDGDGHVQEIIPKNV